MCPIGSQCWNETRRGAPSVSLWSLHRTSIVQVESMRRHLWYLIRGCYVRPLAQQPATVVQDGELVYFTTDGTFRRDPNLEIWKVADLKAFEECSLRGATLAGRVAGRQPNDLPIPAGHTKVLNVTSHIVDGANYFVAKHNSAATTHVAVFDQDGNSVSMTTSIGINFGSKILSKSTGVLLNGDMTAFSFGGSGKTYGLPQSPKNFIEGGKRPLSSMCPSILVDQHGNAKLAIGGAGGSRIISGVALSLVRHLIFDTNICDAVNDPRLHNQLVPNKVYLEEGFSEAIEESLSVEHGHDCIRGMLGEATKPTAVHAVARESSGKLVAVCDKRLSGKPSGF